MLIKNKHLKKQLVASFETLMQRASDYVNYQNLEEFHEFVRSYTNIFTNRIYAIKDFTYSNLVSVSGDQDLRVLNMRREDYIVKNCKNQ